MLLGKPDSYSAPFGAEPRRSKGAKRPRVGSGGGVMRLLTESACFSAAGRRSFALNEDLIKYVIEVDAQWIFAPCAPQVEHISAEASRVVVVQPVWIDH